jgi:hypothetical protein
MSRGHRVFIVERNSMATSDAADKVRAQRIVKLDWVTKKVVAHHMTRGATDAESGVKDCLKQRPMSRNLEL